MSKGICVSRTEQSRKTCMRKFRAYFAKVSSDDNSRKHRQRAGPRKKLAGMSLPTGDAVAPAKVDVLEVHEAHERAEVA
jgi:hypothetical protein